MHFFLQIKQHITRLSSGSSDDNRDIQGSASITSFIFHTVRQTASGQRASHSVDGKLARITRTVSLVPSNSSVGFTVIFWILPVAQQYALWHDTSIASMTTATTDNSLCRDGEQRCCTAVCFTIAMHVSLCRHLMSSISNDINAVYTSYDA